MGVGHRERSTVRSLWDATLPDDRRFRGRPLDGDRHADVVIVGAGLTGLWTAYYLSLAAPDASIVVLERDTVGFGASGRNGGWCSALLPVGLGALAQRFGRPAVVRLQREMYSTVDEVARVVALEGIDCDFVKGGTIDLVRNAAQQRRSMEQLDEHRAFGFDDADLCWLSAEETLDRMSASRVLGALMTPHCAALHPARLVHGLASVVAARGVVIHEQSAVHGIEAGAARTRTGTVRAPVVLRATEAYSSQLPGLRRTVVPLYSMMIATDPLPESQWEEIGLTGRQTFADHRHTVIYGQRTGDGRLAFGGRGAPYHFGSAIRPGFDADRSVRDRLVETLRELLPGTADVGASFHWGGPLGVPRDLSCSITFDRRTGLGSAGGYVGDGVATSNLAGRTLAALVHGTESPLLHLPWVGHRSRRWEPEPLRWLGINAARLAASRADRTEFASERTSSLGGRFLRALGRH